MINLFNLKNSILTWLVGSIALLLAIFTIRKGGADAQKHKHTQTTLENVETSKQVQNDVAAAPATELKRMRKKWTRSNK